MPLANGTRLGPYELLGPLGAGGMGEVYRARDTRLERSVAVKVIPSHLAAETEVRQRFEREARAVSSLNHPHICVLHDLGHEGGVYFFVMEYMEGETLAARLERGALPVDECLRIGIQVADALSAAHRAGIVHRDLKPGNIMLTKSGAKLLDFGLARAAGLAAAPASDLTQSPTLSRPLTAEGTIVGTFQYMAPEQLEGKEADARTDIFALGAVLYEAATGKRAFEGSSQASLIASILKETPRPMSELAPLTPPAFEHAVKRCLGKDPEDRWQSARDLMMELSWIHDAGSQAGVPAPVAAHRRVTARLAWIVAGTALAAVAMLAFTVVRNRPPAPQVVRFGVMPPPHAGFMPAQTASAVSPDGRSLVFAAADSLGTLRLWLRPFDAASARMLPGTENALHPFWSPDSRHIAFFSVDKLRRLSVADGHIQTIVSSADGRGGAWSPQGIIVYQPGADGPLYRVSANGGEAAPVTRIDTTAHESTHRFPCFLPDGRRFLYVSVPPRNGLFDVCVGSLDGMERKVVLRAGGAAMYAPPGYLVFSRDGQLVAKRFDAAKLALVGDPMPIGEPSGGTGGFYGSHGASVSAGVLTHWTQEAVRTRIAVLDRGGRAVGAIATPEGFAIEAVESPDGGRVMLTRWNAADGTADLWIVEQLRNVATRFTHHASENFQAVWSPDGDRVAFTSGRMGRENIFVKGFDGREETMLFDAAALFIKPEAWSPDGSTLVCHVLTEKSGRDLWRVGADGKNAQPFVATPFNEAYAAFSPDGRWLAYISDESGQPEVYAVSFPHAARRIQVSATGAGATWGAPKNGRLVWRRDGREIIYLSADMRSVMSVPVEAGAPPRFGAARSLFRLPRDFIDVTPSSDGQRFLVSVADFGGLPPVHTVVMNWTEALKPR